MLSGATGVLFLLAVAACCGATLLYALGLTLKQRRAAEAGFLALGITLGLFTAGVGLQGIELGRLPLGMPGGTSTGAAWDHPLSALSWALIFAATALGVARPRARIIGAFVAPVALVLLLVRLLAAPRQAVHAMEEATGGTWFGVHIVANYAALALFALAFGAGVVYLLQHGRLKRKEIGEPSLPLPSLESADSILRVSFLGGLAALTLGILAGTGWYLVDEPTGMDLRGKVVATVLIWGVYVLGWQARILLGWSGRRAAWVAIGGFVVLLVSLFGIGHG